MLFIKEDGKQCSGFRVLCRPSLSGQGAGGIAVGTGMSPPARRRFSRRSVRILSHTVSCVKKSCVQTTKQVHLQLQVATRGEKLSEH